MKHKLTIVLVLLGMFLITQLIGLYVVKHYSQDENKLPYGMDPPKLSEKEKTQFFPSIVLAFVIAIALFFLLTKFKVAFILKLWFFAVVIIALGISLNSFFPEYEYSHLIVLALAIPLAIFKVFKRNIIVHNATELLIYPGIAGVFVPLLNIWTMIALLVLISAYDMWAVWHSGIMQKMAKYQMNTLKVFGGFFVPYLSKKQRHQIKKMKKTKKKNKENEKNNENLRIKEKENQNKYCNIRRRGCCISDNNCRSGYENFWNLGGTAYNPRGIIGIKLFVFYIRKKEILSCNAFYNSRNVFNDDY